MKIEILYPEKCCLFGDKANGKYLEECLPEAEIIKTSLADEPRFAKEDVNLIYMGSMTESSQEKIIEKLLPYKEKIQELINNNVVFLLVGNSFEIFTNYIEKEDGTKIEALGILDFYAKRQIPNRFNSLFLGEFENTKIVGYTSRFSNTFGDNSKNYLFKCIKGTGINKESKLEGIRKNNLFATYLLGPLLISNPEFTKYILSLIGVESPKLKYEQEAKKAYEVRLKEFESNIKFN